MSRVLFNGVEYDKMLLLRLGEVSLKGLNRRRFVDQILRSLRYRTRDLAELKVKQDQSRLWLIAEPEKDFPIAELLAAIKPVFGYVSASPLRSFETSLAAIEAEVLDYVSGLFREGQTASFKFTVKRVDKSFELNSYELCSRLGALLLQTYPEQLRVDVHQPDYEFTLELRENGQTYLYHESYPAYRGLPVGMSGKGLLLLSGGLDSPVAGFKMASRGMRLEAIYFHTFPYTSEEAKEKVISLAQHLAAYAGQVKLHIVDFTPCQLAINKAVKAELLTVIMRRMMFRIAERLAESRGIGALISGESLGQVASQTLEALQCIDCLCELPLFRPLIGTDKDEIVEIARAIGTFETSILPYEDCCTVFVAKHPKTRPTIAECEQEEAKFDWESLIEDALSRIETLSLDLD
ncbi:MAG: tRNA uracil 4-sulfurtransferase ThiI [Eubacteriales bacterium]|nr:tRNA uracil 4-sulfurtransferase ThiI [Eubacteriales bacterium]